MAAIFRSRRTFLRETMLKIKYVNNIAVSITDILSFWSMF